MLVDNYFSILNRDKLVIFFFTDPENILLYAISDQGQGHVGFIDLDGAPSVERTLVAKSLRPVAVGYDPTKQVNF